MKYLRRDGLLRRSIVCSPRHLHPRRSRTHLSSPVREHRQPRILSQDICERPTAYIEGLCWAKRLPWHASSTFYKYSLWMLLHMYMLSDNRGTVLVDSQAAAWQSSRPRIICCLQAGLLTHLIVEVGPTVGHLGAAGPVEVALHHVQEALVVGGAHPRIAHDAATRAAQALRDAGGQRGPRGAVALPPLCMQPMRLELIAVHGSCARRVPRLQSWR